MPSPALEILRLTERLIAGEIGIVEGCRQMVPHLGPANLRDDDDAVVILAVESETDDLPVGQARSLWNQEALAGLDREREEYEDRLRAQVITACRSLAEK